MLYEIIYWKNIFKYIFDEIENNRWQHWNTEEKRRIYAQFPVFARFRECKRDERIIIILRWEMYLPEQGQVFVDVGNYKLIRLMRKESD